MNTAYCLIFQSSDTHRLFGSLKTKKEREEEEQRWQKRKARWHVDMPNPPNPLPERA